MKKSTIARSIGVLIFFFLLYLMGVMDQHSDALAFFLVVVIAIIEGVVVPGLKRRET